MIRKGKNLKTQLTDFTKTMPYNNEKDKQIQLQNQLQNQQQENESLREHYERYEKLERKRKKIRDKATEGKLFLKEGVKQKLETGQSLMHGIGDEKDAIHSLHIMKNILSGSGKTAIGMYKLLSASTNLIKHLIEKRQAQKEYIQDVKKTSTQIIEDTANKTYNALHNSNTIPRQPETVTNKQPEISHKKTKTKKILLKR